ncbi:MAG: glycosyl transferase family 2, partial [Gemmatimonadetes bacterium]|nr:glycosyl transferase family 2 [Gemmatimonadota bacterium]
MIVRNEAHVIRRALESARPLVDAWVICDTGSTDGTPEVIAEVMAGIPGELHHVPWVDFGHNR